MSQVEQQATKDLLVRSKEFTAEDRGLGWRTTATSFCILAFTTGVAATGIWLPWPVRLGFAITGGLVTVRVFCLFHDFQHGAILRHSKTARALYGLFGTTILTPPTVWRETHNYHHAHTAKLVGSHIGSFPVLTPAMYRSLSLSKRIFYRSVRHPINMLLAVFTVFGIGMCLSPLLRAPKKHWQALPALLFPLALATVAYGFHRFDAFVYGWFIPMGVAAFAGSYLFYAQHNVPGMHIADRANWNYIDAAIQSSSYMVMGPVMNWFTANIGYHQVHHLNAAIPFYRLPEAMEALPELQQAPKTSLKLRDVIACLRLNFWDPEQQTFRP